MNMPRTSLKWRLSLSIGTLAFFCTVIVWQLASQLTQEQIERDQGALLQNIAVRMSAQVAQDMSTRASEIIFLTGLDLIRSPKTTPEKKREIFERVRNAYPYYSWIGITDTEGNIITGTDGLLTGKSVAKRDWFQRGTEGLYFGDAHDAFLLAKMLPKPQWDDLPLRLVDISAPVHDENGNFIGVLCGHLSLDWAFETRERMLDQLSRDQLDLLVLNHEGKVLMGTPHLPSLTVNLNSLSTVQGLSNTTRQVAIDTWPDQKKYLTASVRETPFRNYPGMGWIFVARKPLAVALEPAANLSKLILIAGAGTATLFFVILWLILSRILRPLEEISALAVRIRNHDTHAQIPRLRGNDEVSIFARSLADLVNWLRESNSQLTLTSRVFDESGQGIMITDASTSILRVNQAFQRITGYSANEAIGNPPSLLRSGMQDAAFYQALWNKLNRDGVWQGEIWNRHKNGNFYPEWLTIYSLKNEKNEVTNYLAIFDDITEKKDYERRLVHLANYDSLTDLPNRNLLQQYVDSLMQEALKTSGIFALIFIDLDKFKNINDTLGHEIGDNVLKEVSHRFSAKLDGQHFLSRWGGDEFVVVMRLQAADQAAHLARGLSESLQRSFIISGKPYHIGMSAGISLFPSDGKSFHDLLRCADTAMYKAKHGGPGCYRFYEHSMNDDVEKLLRIDNALRQTLQANGQGLSLAFQPQMDASGREIKGMEVLVRWNHPDLGSVSPADFIPIAEETGQILNLGDWIIKETIASFVAIRRKLGRPIQLSMNLSAQQLHRASLAEKLLALCSDNGIDPEYLMIEVTETAIISDESKVISTLRLLKSSGFKISIDDFGTGYSCLNYIQQISPREIKVDQSFVARMISDSESYNIVQFTYRLARSLDMSIVAEGVETLEQLEALRSMGNFTMQGYHFSKPLPMDEAVAFIVRLDDQDGIRS